MLPLGGALCIRRNPDREAEERERIRLRVEIDLGVTRLYEIR
jgi:hypothetical protein